MTIAAKKIKTHRNDWRISIKTLEAHAAALRGVDVAAMTKADARELADALTQLSGHLTATASDIRRAAYADEIKEVASFRKAQESAYAARQEKIREKKAADVEKMISWVYKVKIRDKLLGDIWSNELEQYKTNGAFEASLFDQLRKHATPSTPTKVRNMVSENVLEQMITIAEQAAGGKYQP